jgi:hypothetical protein
MLFVERIQFSVLSNLLNIFKPVAISQFLVIVMIFDFNSANSGISSGFLMSFGLATLYNKV